MVRTNIGKEDCETGSEFRSIMSKNIGVTVNTTTVKERPILFSGPMVRAILDGRKTQTRRIVKGSGIWSVCGEDLGFPWPGQEDESGEWRSFTCPYGEPGERLWVREAWARVIVGNQIDYLYRADTHTGLEKRDGDQKWKPSIHMPRVACRLMVEITSVRVERLQDISEEDATNEGAQCAGFPASLTNRGAFGKLWQSINGPDSWAANPWVWVVEFRKV
jgi:hypothetical protein